MFAKVRLDLLNMNLDILESHLVICSVSALLVSVLESVQDLINVIFGLCHWQLEEVPQCENCPFSVSLVALIIRATVVLLLQSQIYRFLGRQLLVGLVDLFALGVNVELEQRHAH